MGIFNNKPQEKQVDPSNLIGSMELYRIELPVLKETSNSKYIEYGEFNNYPQELINLSKMSALHRMLLENKTRMICGSDILINDTPLKDWVMTLNGIQSIRIQSLFYNKKYPLKDWIKRVAYDYMIFGAFSTEVMWDSDFEYIKIMKHLDTSRIRCAPMNEKREITKYFFSNEWGKWSPSNITPIYTFDLDNREYYNQIIYKKDYYPGLDYYSEPSYIGALTNVALDSELSIFSLNYIKNGLHPGLMFQVPYQFQNQEEKVKFITALKNELQGARNNNNPIILAKNGEAKWEIEKIETKNFDQELIALGDVILQRLIFAHKINNPALVGLLVPGKLGTSTGEDLAYSTAQFMKNVIEPARLMLEEVLEDILLTHGLDVKIKII